jgi:hypothetical protein
MTTNTPTPPANAQDKATEIAKAVVQRLTAFGFFGAALTENAAEHARHIIRFHLAPPPAPAMDVVGKITSIVDRVLRSADQRVVVVRDAVHALRDIKRILASAPATAPAGQLPTTNADATTAPASQPAASERDAGGEQVMPKVNGQSFCCDCGCNVFTKIGELHYRCNGCGATYTGERQDARASQADAKQDPPPAPQRTNGL